MVTSTLEPIVAIVSASLVLGENLNQVQVGGAILVLGAIVLLQFRRGTEIETPPGPPLSASVDVAQ
jgi:drug/metabolite transporter (DMT)-like permease